jgi:hypothetical protein
MRTSSKLLLRKPIVCLLDPISKSVLKLTNGPLPDFDSCKTPLNMSSYGNAFKAPTFNKEVSIVYPKSSYRIIQPVLTDKLPACSNCSSQFILCKLVKSESIKLSRSLTVHKAQTRLINSWIYSVNINRVSCATIDVVCYMVMLDQHKNFKNNSINSCCS